MESPTVAEPSLEECLERAVRSRLSDTSGTNTSQISTPEELEYMQAAIRESARSPSLREFIVRLCKSLAVELVRVEFGLSVDAHTGCRPSVCIVTREDVSASVRQDMEGLVGRIVHTMKLDACGYRVLVVPATEAEGSG